MHNSSFIDAPILSGRQEYPNPAMAHLDHGPCRCQYRLPEPSSPTGSDSTMKEVTPDDYHASFLASGPERSMPLDDQNILETPPAPVVEYTVVNSRILMWDMVQMIKTNLRKITTIIGYPDLEFLPDSEAAAILPYVVFEVSTAEQLEATARAGFLVPQEGGEPIKVYYQKYTHIHHEQHESRRVTLKSMAWNTKADDVHAAMAAWGTVASVRMGFNAQKSMATATVHFQHSGIDNHSTLSVCVQN
ncbi:hypothetical protein BGZ51_002437 [Haplosporangium sp. Z 767]|nr:hypothetical protein BGZ51_002437 [Haplosporangium sp. Z 767]KAF9187247.1 hypothetical protein BGZ50_002043 [Haplosporangium sp. Z 11]